MPFWDRERCPADWKDSTHVLGASGKCEHCHERPEGYTDAAGEVL